MYKRTQTRTHLAPEGISSPHPSCEEHVDGSVSTGYAVLVHVVFRVDSTVVMSIGRVGRDYQRFYVLKRLICVNKMCFGTWSSWE